MRLVEMLFDASEAAFYWRVGGVSNFVQTATEGLLDLDQQGNL
jgi:hypothetical protein